MTPSTPPLHDSPSPEVCYRAMQARDARFDGSFFVGVSSTGIYCRPVCRVRLPKVENCHFFELAAQAEQAGYRPCLRCRPELAPGSLVWSMEDASRMLAHQAAHLLDEPDAWGEDPPTVDRLAQRLGVSDRHLRRIFEAQWGVSPIQYLQTRRLLTAKQLLADTHMPVTQVALVSGFGSVRRFNTAFKAHYRLQPSALRREARADHTMPLQAEWRGSAITTRLAYRPPYDIQAMLSFLRTRQIHGVEHADDQSVSRTLRITQGPQVYQGWMHARFDLTVPVVHLSVSDSLREVLPLVIRRARSTLDLDAEPHAIHQVLHRAFPDSAGLRVPGTMDGFELAVRAVLGQQITVAAARTLAQRLVQRFGVPVSTPFETLTHLFPSAETLAAASGNDLGELGIVKQRQAAIVALAQAVAAQRLPLHAGTDVQATMATLRTLPGIGDWTAQYIAMRALRWPDAFPAGDVALHKALGVQTDLGGHKKSTVQASREALTLSEAWRPWRSYAVLWAWHTLNSPATLNQNAHHLIANNDVNTAVKA